jgi:ABC-2 type transport system ATP-binding protein
MLTDDSMIHTVDLRVDYGNVTAVADLNLDIRKGDVFGLIGPNGSGKTSTIRVLATLLDPTYGDVHIAGMDIAVQPAAVRRLLGYMPDSPPVYESLKCWEMLDLFASAYGIPRRERRRLVGESLEKVSLTAKRNAMAGTLSRGMKQRLVLAKTLLSDPDVLLLDEPASGLDPIARIEMRNLLADLARLGKTVLISSHILTELSTFCTSIGIMEKGRLVLSGSIDEIIDKLSPGRTIRVDLTAPPSTLDGQLSAAMAWLDENATVTEIRMDEKGLALDFHGDDEAAAALLRGLIERNVPIRGFYESRMSVEDIMLSVGAREVS